MMDGADVGTVMREMDRMFTSLEDGFSHLDDIIGKREEALDHESESESDHRETASEGEENPEGYA